MSTLHPAQAMGIDAPEERVLIALVRAARARAFLDGRAYVSPQDVKSVGLEVLRHRVLTTYEAEAEGVTGEDVVTRLFDHVPIP